MLFTCKINQTTRTELGMQYYSLVARLKGRIFFILLLIFELMLYYLNSKVHLIARFQYISTFEVYPALDYSYVP